MMKHGDVVFFDWNDPDLIEKTVEARMKAYRQGWKDALAAQTTDAESESKLTTPERTPAQVLTEIWYQCPDEDESASLITEAAALYAQEHPEWFDADLISNPAEMLWQAANHVHALGRKDVAASHVLKAAFYVVLDHPEWFGGEV